MPGTTSDRLVSRTVRERLRSNSQWGGWQWRASMMASSLRKLMWWVPFNIPWYEQDYDIYVTVVFWSDNVGGIFCWEESIPWSGSIHPNQTPGWWRKTRETYKCCMLSGNVSNDSGHKYNWAITYCCLYKGITAVLHMSTLLITLPLHKYCRKQNISTHVSNILA